MLLLYYTPVVMYRGVFTVGIVLIGVTSSSAITSANALTDYSYVNARDSVTSGTQIARCVTGLGPSAPDDNSAVGEVYFNGNRIPNVACSDSSSPIIIRQPAGLNNLGVININQCATLSTAVEGIYTCIMMNSSMMNESIRFGVYFTGRSELLYTVPLNYNFTFTRVSTCGATHGSRGKCQKLPWKASFPRDGPWLFHAKTRGISRHVAFPRDNTWHFH